MILQVRNILFVLLLIFLPHAAGSQGTKDIEQIISKGDSLLFQKRFNEARDLYIQAQRTAVDASNHYLKHLCQYKEAYSYLPEDNHAKALSILTNVQLELSPQCKEDSALLFLVEREIEVLDYQCIHPDYDISIIEKEYVKMLPFLSNEQHRSRATYLMGRIHQLRVELSNTIDYYESLLGAELSDKFLWEVIHYGLVETLYYMEDYKKVLDITKKVGNKPLYYYNRIKFDRYRAHAYYAMSRYSEALSIYKQIIDKNHNDSSVYFIIQNAYTVSAICNLQLGDTVKAIRLFKLSETCNTLIQDRVDAIIFLYHKWANLYSRSGEYELALNAINKGEQIIKDFTVAPSERFPLFTRKSHILRKQGDTLNAITYIDSISSFNRLSDQDNWRPRDWTAYNKMLRAHYYTKRVYYYDSGLDTTGLNKLYRKFTEVLKTTNNVYKQTESIESKYDIQKYIRYDYENLFLTAFLLKNASESDEYFQDMLEFIERGKAIQFKSELARNEWLSETVVPHVILENEKQIKLYVERIRYLLNSEDKLDESKRQELISELPYAQYRYDSIRELTDSYKTKIQEQQTNISVSQVQEKIGSDQIVLNYFTTEGRLFVFLIGKQFADLQEVNLKHDIRKLSSEFHELIENYSIENDTRLQFIEFKEKSSTLYNYLIKPFESEIEAKRLVLIPDRELGLIPFDALIVNSLGNNYSELNYLIKTNPIAEVYSLKQLDYRSDKLNRHSKFIGFAPSYSEYDRAKYQPLAAATEEVQQIGAYFSGVSYEGEFATKKRFLDEARKYDIVHLALHTKLNELQPQYSQLLFSEKDNPLSIYELYGDRFKTKLIVLGGCNTGKGIVRYGEGVTNLARDFFFTGVKNVILAKWEISDKSSANLMNGFYRSLHDKNPVDVALQKAKVDYLVNVDPLKSHPYYWAGFTTVGKPVHVSSTSKDLHYIAGGFILLSLVLVAIRRSKV